MSSASSTLISFCFIYNQLFLYTHCSDLERYYIPTQEQFIAQQTQALLHHKSHDVSSSSLGFPILHSGTAAASSSSSAAFSFGLRPSEINSNQFFGGAFGLGFGFGGPGGWYPFPLIPNQNINFGQAKPSDVTVPTLLKPSDTGWDTAYNVPCGSYKIRPFVIANLRLGTSSSPFYGKNRRKRGASDTYNDGSSGVGTNPGQSERSYFPYFPIYPEPKSCSWNFNSDGPCKLKFKCVWFQLPAVFSCNENYLLVSDSTSNLNNTFCGNRKPRKVYNSSNGKLILTFRSQSSSLPAVFDCAVTCTLEASYGQGLPQQSAEREGKPPTKLIPIPDSSNSSSSSSSENSSNSTSSIEIVKEKPRMRIGDCKCGVQDGHYSSRGRIVGGTSTYPAEFPWVAALVKKSSSISSSTRPFCGASLISDRYVLTAAHCVLNNKIIREPRSIYERGLGRNPRELFDVLLTEHDVNRLDEVPGGTIRVAVDKVIVHPKYDNVTFNFDIALIRLEKRIDFISQLSNYQYQNGFDFNLYKRRRRFIPEVEARPTPPRPTPICLPSDSDTLLEDNSGIITGWGLQTEGGIPSNELLKATVKIFNDTTCKDLYKEYNYPVTKSMMCAGYLEGKIDSCVGDSGGGLVIREDGRYILAGITSWGRGCGRKGQPGVYTRVPELIEWIRSEASDGVWCV